jgi:hypothetical protein
LNADILTDGTIAVGDEVSELRHSPTRVLSARESESSGGTGTASRRSCWA